MNCSKCGRETSEDGAHGVEKVGNVVSVTCAFCALDNATKAAGLEGGTQQIVLGCLGLMFQTMTGKGKSEHRFFASLTNGCYAKTLEVTKKVKPKLPGKKRAK